MRRGEGGACPARAARARHTGGIRPRGAGKSSSNRAPERSVLRAGLWKATDRAPCATSQMRVLFEQLAFLLLWISRRVLFLTPQVIHSPARFLQACRSSRAILTRPLASSAASRGRDWGSNA